LDRQIRTTSNQLEVVIEQYDAIRGSLRRTKTQEVTVEHQLQPLHAAVTAARARVGLIAASVYETTSFGPLVTLMDAGSASQALANLSTINQVARVRQAQIHRLYDAASAYTSRQAKLRDLDAQQSNTYATLAAKRSTIISQIAKLKSLRVAAYGPTGMVATAPVSGFVPVYSPGAAGQSLVLNPIARTAHQPLTPSKIMNRPATETTAPATMSVVSLRNAPVRISNAPPASTAAPVTRRTRRPRWSRSGRREAVAIHPGHRARARPASMATGSSTDTADLGGDDTWTTDVGS
jgi:hypothetical protein